MEKVSKRDFTQFCHLVMYLLGKEIVISKENIIEHARNNNIIQFLLEKVQDDEAKLLIWKESIPSLNNYINIMLNNTRLDNYGDLPNYNIFNADTQGLNTLLVMIINCIEQIIEI